VTPRREKPLFAWYSNTYLHRSENFFHRQLCGMNHAADVQVLSQWTTNLDEFPAPLLYCAENAASFTGRMKNALVRRLWPERNRYTLRPYVTRRLAGQIKSMCPNLIYCLFGWHASQLLDVLAIDGCDGVPFIYHAGGSDILAADSIGPEYVHRLRQTFDRAALVLCGSQFLLSKVLLLGAPPEKVKLHYIGIDIPCETRTSLRGIRRASIFGFLAIAGSLLNCHAPANRPFLVGQPHFTHAALADQLEQMVGVDDRAGGRLIRSNRVGGELRFAAISGCWAFGVQAVRIAWPGLLRRHNRTFFPCGRIHSSSRR